MPMPTSPLENSLSVKVFRSVNVLVADLTGNITFNFHALLRLNLLSLHEVG